MGPGDGPRAPDGPVTLGGQPGCHLPAHPVIGVLMKRIDQ